MIGTFRRRFGFCSWVFNFTRLRYHSHFARHPGSSQGETTGARLSTGGRNENLVFLQWVLRKIQQWINAAVFRQPLIAEADSLSFRPISTNGAPRDKWRHPIENSFGNPKEFKRIAMRADKTTQASAPSSISPPRSSIRYNLTSLRQEGACADLRPYTARSINDRICAFLPLLGPNGSECFGSKVAGKIVGWDVRFIRLRAQKQTDRHRPGSPLPLRAFTGHSSRGKQTCHIGP